MSDMKLYAMLVIKDFMKDQERPIPDIAFVLAYDRDEAVKTVREHNWVQAYWVKGKSVCRIVKIIEVGGMLKPGLMQMVYTGEMSRVFAGQSAELRNLLGISPPEGISESTSITSCIGKETETLNPSPRGRTRQRASTSGRETTPLSTSSQPATERAPMITVRRRRGRGQTATN